MSVDQLVYDHTIQIAMLAAGVWLFTAFVSKSQSHLTFALWLVVLVKCVTPPLWSSPVSFFGWLETTWHDTSPPLHSQPAPEPFPPTLTPETNHQEPVISEKTPQRLDVPRLEREDTQIRSTPVVMQRKETASNPPPFHKARWVDWYFIRNCLGAAWCTISGALLVFSLSRAMHFVHRVASSTQDAADLQSRVNQLSKQLKLKGSAAICVTSLPIGPAVIGLFHPTIVLPELLTKELSKSELDPILAHELIHIRRRDLWIGLLRHFACSIWWFHPFVWKAARELRRGAENCCDEEVVSSIGVSASNYARSLISVLELKQQLKVIPVAPGVRPFDITAHRLERIMKFGIHGRKRTPVWCWMIAIALGMVTLPGAGRMTGQETEPNRVPPSDISESNETTYPALSNGISSQITNEEPALEGSLPTLEDTASSEPSASAASFEMETLPWALLQRRPEKSARLIPGDVLGIYIEGILGDDDLLPPVNIPTSSNTPPSMGYPIQIRDDGTISIPLADPLKVAGLTLKEAQANLVKTYTVDNKLISPGEERILLTMVRPAHIRVFVFREDLPPSPLSRSADRQDDSSMLALPSNQADILTALAKTGGLPKESVAEVVIQRRVHDVANEVSDRVETIRIPLRYPANQRPDISDADITLRDNDILILRSTSVPPTTDWNLENVLPNPQQPMASPPDPTPSTDPPSNYQEPLLTRPTGPLSIEGVRARRKISLVEAIQIALENAKVLQTLGAKPRQSSTPGRIALQRENADQQTPDIEINIRNFVFEVCQCYWELHFHHQNLDAARRGFADAHDLWKKAKQRLQAQVAGGEAKQEAQARTQYFAFKSRLQQANSDLHHAESRLRFLLGLRPHEEQFLVPSDSPTKANVAFDWDELRRKSLQSSPELKRQRMRVALLEKKTLAVKQTLLPTAGVLSRERETAGQQVSAHAELADLELRLRRAQKLLEDMELEIAHHTSSALRRQRDQYVLAQTRFNAAKAARDQVAAATTGYAIAQNVPLDVVLDAVLRQQQSEVDYLRALTEYQRSTAEVHYRSGSLLTTCGVEFEVESKQDYPSVDPTGAFYPAKKSGPSLGLTVF